MRALADGPEPFADDCDAGQHEPVTADRHRDGCVANPYETITPAIGTSVAHRTLPLAELTMVPCRSRWPRTGCSMRSAAVSCSGWPRA